MTAKYTKKDFIENITKLTSPFEENKQNGQGLNIAEKIKQVLGRNKGVAEGGRT